MIQKRSIQQVIRTGQWVVNGPVLVLLVGPLSAFAYAVESGWVSRERIWVGLPLFAGSFAMAWLWWSLTIARWRVWAYARVDNIPALKEQAVAAGLIWPDGHVFEETELKSRRLAQRQRALDPQKEPPTQAGRPPAR